MWCFLESSLLMMHKNYNCVCLYRVFSLALPLKVKVWKT